MEEEKKTTERVKQILVFLKKGAVFSLNEEVSLDISGWYDEEEERYQEFWAGMGHEEGYIDKKCPKCGRHRVIHWSCGKDICEKCNWCQQTGKYMRDYKGDLFY